MSLLAEVCIIIGVTFLVMFGTLVYLCCKRPVFIALPGRVCPLFTGVSAGGAARVLDK